MTTPYPTLRLKLVPQAALKVKFTPILPSGGVRYDATQSLTNAQKLQARTNIGVDASGDAVPSVFGRTGNVVAATNDYTVAQVTGAAPLASPTFTGDPKAPTPSPGDNDTSIATTAFVATSFQPLDADLTAIAALGGTNTIYYRNGASSWAPVTVSTGLDFTGGILTSTVATNVEGPVSSTDNAVALWDGTSGDTLKDSPMTVAADTVTINGASVLVALAQTNPALYAIFDWFDQGDIKWEFGRGGDTSADPNAFYLYQYESAAGAAVAQYRMYVTDAGLIGLGTAAPATRLHVEHDSSATNAITEVARIASTSSGTPATGIGVGLGLAVETAANNIEVGARIDAVTTDVTSTSEDFDLLFKIMRAGAAASEVLRLSNDWPYWTDPNGVKSYLPKTIALASNATTNSTTTGVEITNLRATNVPAGTYTFKYVIRYQSGATTTGVRFGVNHTGTAAVFAANLGYGSLGSQAANQAASVFYEGSATRTKSTTAPNLGPSASVDSANADMLAIIEGFIIVTVAGNLALWHASEVAAASTVMAGSSLTLQRVA